MEDGMNKTATLKARVQAVLDRNSELEKEASDLRSQLETYQKRERAENIIMNAREAGNAPDKLTANTIDDFISKRAKLESSSFDHLDKMASIVELFDSDDFSLEDVGEGHKRGDLTSWLRDQA